MKPHWYWREIVLSPDGWIITTESCESWRERTSQTRAGQLQFVDDDDHYHPSLHDDQWWSISMYRTFILSYRDVGHIFLMSFSFPSLISLKYNEHSSSSSLSCQSLIFLQKIINFFSCIFLQWKNSLSLLFFVFFAFFVFLFYLYVLHSFSVLNGLYCMRGTYCERKRKGKGMH